ncbi:MAG: hypothetical protein ABII06_09295, partial [Pseudomonadota bacterium]
MKVKTKTGRQQKQGSDAALHILGALIVAAVAFSLFKGGWELTFLGLKNAGVLFEKVWFRLLLGFLLGGFIQVLIPRNLISKWLGAGIRHQRHPPGLICQHVRHGRPLCMAAHRCFHIPGRCGCRSRPLSHDGPGH